VLCCVACSVCLDPSRHSIVSLGFADCDLGGVVTNSGVVVRRLGGFAS